MTIGVRESPPPRRRRMCVRTSETEPGRLGCRVGVGRPGAYAAAARRTPPYALLTGLRNVPTPSIAISTMSPSLRKRGGDSGEYGATTGRPRRVGWFDAVATRYGCRLHGATEIALTMLDVLKYLDEIPICTAYKLGSKTTLEFPNPSDL